MSNTSGGWQVLGCLHSTSLNFGWINTGYRIKTYQPRSRLDARETEAIGRSNCLLYENWLELATYTQNIRSSYKEPF